MVYLKSKHKFLSHRLKYNLANYLEPFKFKSVPKKSYFNCSIGISYVILRQFSNLDLSNTKRFIY